MRATDKPRPQDLAAERAVLGAMLLHNELADGVFDELAPDDFLRDAHRAIYVALMELREAGVALDFLTLRDALIRADRLEMVGGPAYLTALVDGIPRTTNIAHYAAIVKEKARLRAAIRTAERLIERCYDHEASSDIVPVAAEALSLIGDSATASRPAPVGAMLPSFLQTLERPCENGVSGLSTGLKDLDRLTTGLHPADYIIVAARTSVGKTAMALNILKAVGAAAVGAALLFSLEMPKEQILTRMMASTAMVDSWRLRARKLTESDQLRIGRHLPTMEASNVWVDDSARLTVPEMRARARAVRAEAGLAIIVVDYLQLVKARGKFDNRAVEVGSISHALRALAKELRVPLVALAQLNRGPEQRKDRRPVLSDLRESGDLENDADLVVLLWRDEDRPDLPAEAIVAKQRNGPQGTVRLAYLREYTTFADLAV